MIHEIIITSLMEELDYHDVPLEFENLRHFLLCLARVVNEEADPEIANAIGIISTIVVALETLTVLRGEA